MAKVVHFLEHFSRNGSRQGAWCWNEFAYRILGLGAGRDPSFHSEGFRFDNFFILIAFFITLKEIDDGNISDLRRIS